MVKRLQKGIGTKLLMDIYKPNKVKQDPQGDQGSSR
jgi:hypothetical protein